MRKKKEERVYRRHARAAGLESFQVAVKETDLFISAERRLDTMARDLILERRGYIENYIRSRPEFVQSLLPLPMAGPAPEIVRRMIEASGKSGVGPMAAVAGAIAEEVGRGLLEKSRQVIVENGGDVFIKTDAVSTVGVFAGKSALSGRLGIRVDSSQAPVSVCASSGSLGHSKSMGKADAVCVISGSCALADAAATAIGNHVKTKSDLKRALDFGKTIPGVRGVLIIMDDKVGIWGDVKAAALDG
ncbi:conserved hypothetical protein [Candidatus Desulfarcum epimagneticum]|uniref:Uncharacterized protein n=1 Tax=uncultured Desulfobacteraceae bacterium TaxID=218296 RepID=A0A484HE60_9BACT|nr:conserved hypothetical protein [uncultured Desulfobacteraceae bacterium]